MLQLVLITLSLSFISKVYNQDINLQISDSLINDHSCFICEKYMTQKFCEDTACNICYLHLLHGQIDNIPCERCLFYPCKENIERITCQSCKNNYEHDLKHSFCQQCSQAFLLAQYAVNMCQICKKFDTEVINDVILPEYVYNENYKLCVENIHLRCFFKKALIILSRYNLAVEKKEHLIVTFQSLEIFDCFIENINQCITTIYEDMNKKPIVTREEFEIYYKESLDLDVINSMIKNIHDLRDVVLKIKKNYNKYKKITDSVTFWKNENIGLHSDDMYCFTEFNDRRKCIDFSNQHLILKNVYDIMNCNSVYINNMVYLNTIELVEMLQLIDFKHLILCYKGMTCLDITAFSDFSMELYCVTIFLRSTYNMYIVHIAKQLNITSIYLNIDFQNENSITYIQHIFEIFYPRIITINNPPNNLLLVLGEHITSKENRIKQVITKSKLIKMESYFDVDLYANFRTNLSTHSCVLTLLKLIPHEELLQLINEKIDYNIQFTLEIQISVEDFSYNDNFREDMHVLMQGTNIFEKLEIRFHSDINSYIECCYLLKVIQELIYYTKNIFLDSNVINILSKKNNILYRNLNIIQVNNGPVILINLLMFNRLCPNLECIHLLSCTLVLQSHEISYTSKTLEKLYLTKMSFEDVIHIIEIISVKMLFLESISITESDLQYLTNTEITEINVEYVDLLYDKNYPEIINLLEQFFVRLSNTRVKIISQNSV